MGACTDVRYPDRGEVHAAGDACHAPAGHPSLLTAGTELVELRPTTECGRTMAAVPQNLQTMPAA